MKRRRWIFDIEDEDLLLTQAGAALGGVRLSLQDVIRGVMRGGPKFPSNVVRCRVQDGSTDLPATVIVKQSNWPGQALAEWIALEFLNSLPDVSSNAFVPRLLGTDQCHELVIMEDLGPMSLGRILSQADDSSHARHALLGLMQTLATIHTATFGEECLHKEIAVRIGPCRSRETIASKMNRILQAFPVLAEDVGVPIDSDTHRELEKVNRLLNSPEPFWGLVQGDLNPGNIIENDGHMSLCDFVPSAYYNVLIEGVYPLIYYLAHGDIDRYPDDVLTEMFDEYIHTLGTHCPAATEDELVGPHIVAASAAWMVYMLEKLPDFMEKDSPRGVFTHRQSILYCLDTFACIAQRYDCFPSLAGVATKMSCQLKSIWSCDRVTVPLCRAFLN
jgi:hypothetical protein